MYTIVPNGWLGEWYGALVVTSMWYLHEAIGCSTQPYGYRYTPPTSPKANGSGEDTTMQ